MSAPRQLLPGSTYLITRRCTQRQFLIKPSKRLNQAFSYVLAVASSRYQVAVHAFCVLSNHWLCLEDSDDVFDKVLYTLCNPVSSFLVERRSEWPGLVADWTCEPRSVERPDWFFRANGPIPAHATLELVPPTCFAKEAPRSLVTRLRTAAAQREAMHRRYARKHRIRFLGAESVLRQKTTSSPHTVAPRRGISPRIAATDKWRRIEALRRLESFVREYRETWLLWKAGFRDVVFPASTYAMCKHQGATCVQL